MDMPLLVRSDVLRFRSLIKRSLRSIQIPEPKESVPLAASVFVHFWCFARSIFWEVPEYTQTWRRNNVMIGIGMEALTSPLFITVRSSF